MEGCYWLLVPRWRRDRLHVWTNPIIDCLPRLGPGIAINTDSERFLHRVNSVRNVHVTNALSAEFLYMARWV
jgi:hypothetical protein